MTKGKGSKKKRKRNDNSSLVYLFLAALLLLSAALYFLGAGKPSESGKQKAPVRHKIYASIPPPPAAPPGTRRPTPEEEEVSISSLPKLSIIIDDIGYNRRYHDLVDLGVPITLAVIPFTPYGHDAARLAHSAGIEVMLHMPMEPQGYPASNPGESARLTTMDREVVLGKLRAALGDVPYVKGINNHMGSRFTEYTTGMIVVLEEIKKRNLFFIDSRTSPRSKGYAIAKKIGVRSARRSVFIDNVQSEEAIKRQLMKAVRLAKDNGEAIAIGHPYPATTETLRKVIPMIEKEGVELVAASALAR